MSNAKRIPRTEPERVPESLTITESPPPDLLADYRKGLADLSSAAEKLATLRSASDTVQSELAGFETRREALLDSGDDEAVEELSRISSRLEIHRRKLSDLGRRITDALAELESAISVILSQFQGLYRSFYAHEFECQKTKVAEQLIPGAVAEHIVGLVAHHSKALAPIRQLEITATEASGLLAQGARLLEAVLSAEGFNVPPYVPPTPTAPELDPLWTPGVPWGDRGINVQEELDKMHREDPSLNLPRALRLLYERHPEIFAPPKEGTLSLNESLPSLPTGVSDTLMGHVGDTFSSEEEFQRKIATRREKAAVTS